MDGRENNLVIIGASARAAAASAIRAGYRPWCADLFADRDLQAMATVRACPPGEYAQGLLSLIEDYPAGPVLLTGAMENHRDGLESMGRDILGPGLQAMHAMRSLLHNPQQLPSIPGLQWTVTRTADGNGSDSQRWIIKPCRSAGGSRVRLYSDHETIGPQDIMQAFIPGQPIGVVWRGRQHACDMLGASGQIIGDAHLGTNGFQYAGSIGPWPLSPAQRDALQLLGDWLTRQFAITGLFGGDFILDAHGTLWPIEFNPRYTASVEVLETAGDFAALRDDSLPQPARATHGKAYVFARSDGVVPDLYDLFSPADIADVPAVNSDIRQGQPICTVFAQGMDFSSCLAGLHDMAQRLYTRLS